MQLTSRELRAQLACLHCGIAWEGTINQQFATSSNNQAPPQFIDQQLAALSPAEAKKQRRRFRKLWRAHVIRKFGEDFDTGRLTSSAKRAFAIAEALRRFNNDTGL